MANDVTAAVKFVLMHLKEAANWDYYRGKAGTFEQSGRWSDLNEVDACVYLGVRQQPRPVGGSTLEQIQAVARAGRVFGCGNCGEMAAVAFTFLLDRGVRPLDYVHIEPGDHEFVVVGRPAHGGSIPEAWPAAWVCDPWMAGFTKDESRGAYPATNFWITRERMPNVRGVVSLYRVD